MRNIIGLIVVVGVISGAAWATRENQRNRFVWDHWDVVKHGILYRSGQLRPEQLEQAVRTYGIKTVVNFQVQGEGVDSERAVVQKMGIEFMNLPMPGDGFGKEEQFREVLKACDDPARRPVLVHCARGTCRSGASVALYRFERDGWTIEDVAVEMERQTYRQGWLPGYVFAMVKERPNGELFEPRIVREPAKTAEESPHVR